MTDSSSSFTSSSSQPSSLPGLTTETPEPETKSWARPSELHRAIACPASTVLPKTDDDEPGKAAEWGQEVHRWVETGEATERVAKWLAEITDDPEALRNEWWPGGLHEVPMTLSETWGAAYLDTPATDEAVDKFFEGKRIRGIADYIGEGLFTHIVDLKTGRHPPATSPAEIPQLLFYAYCWLRAWPEEPGVLVSIDHWPRYPKGQPPTRYTDYVSQADIRAWFDSALIPAYRLSRKSDAEKDARPGPHCQYCRSAIHCPASL